jgi:hypothetical protein
MRFAFSAVLGLGLVLVACSSPPPAIHAGDVCVRCKRLIAEPKLAVEMIAANGQASTFRTPGCLAKYLKDHPKEAKGIFVTDYPTGKLIPVSRALFVHGKIDENTGERDYYAFASVNDAVERAKHVTGTVVDWAAVRSAIDSEKFQKKGD